MQVYCFQSKYVEIIPVKLFPAKYKFTRLAKLPKAVGIAPKRIQSIYYIQIILLNIQLVIHKNLIYTHQLICLHSILMPPSYLQTS